MDYKGPQPGGKHEHYEKDHEKGRKKRSIKQHQAPYRRNQKLLCIGIDKNQKEPSESFTSTEIICHMRCRKEALAEGKLSDKNKSDGRCNVWHVYIVSRTLVKFTSSSARSLNNAQMVQRGSRGQLDTPRAGSRREVGEQDNCRRYQ